VGLDVALGEDRQTPGFAALGHASSLRGHDRRARDHPGETETLTEFISFQDGAAWESWLREHHEHESGVWLKIAKKASGVASVNIADALDIALSYGWIDSHRKEYDKQFFLQKYTPRRSRSSWSKVNVDKVEALITAGRMQPSGFAQIAAAKADGRWDAAYESQRLATVPPDLAAALEANVAAKRRFESLSRTDRYAVILRLLKANGPAERAARLHKALAALEAES
jgi:uncharacterized protein YdeI (YjbR/CyaY-like superfamily)